MSPLAAFAITEALQYGPTFVKQIIAVLQKPGATIADIELLFAGVKPYSAYGIPDVAPSIPINTSGTNLA